MGAAGPGGASGASAQGAPGPRAERGIPDGLLVGVLALLLGLTLLVWTATGLSALLAHGSWPDGVHFTRTPVAMRHLAAQPHDLAAAWPGTPRSRLSGYGLFWGTFVGELMVLFVLTVFVMGAVARWRAARVQATAGGPGGGRVGEGTANTGSPAAAEGMETAPEGPPVAAEGPPAAQEGTETAPRGPVGAEAAAERGPAPASTAAPADPLTKVPAPAPGSPSATGASEVASEAVAAVPGQRQPRTLGAHYTGARRDARKELAMQAIRAAEGAVLVVTSDAGLWAESKDARAKLGPTQQYDPSHLLDTPARLRWSPAAGCSARDVAAARAAALLAPVRPAHALDSAMADAAETLLRCWLHAAAVDRQPFRQVHRWASGQAAHDPVRILRTHPEAAPGSAGELESVLTAHPERRDVAQQLTGRALAALSSIHIRDACNPTRADTLALESFVAEAGTLYVVGEAIEDPRAHPGAMPLLTALVSSVVEHGRRMAERSSAGRLDPPLTLVLDDIAAVAPLPGLPELLADGPALGLRTLAVLRSEEQAKARWERWPHRALSG